MAGTEDIGHILFYGTLCAREANHARLRLPDALTFVGKRAVPGTLYDLGAYPGLVLGSGTTITELYRIEDPSILPRLDRFEGYDARHVEGSLFLRLPVQVPRRTRSSSSMLDAWIYAFNGSVRGRPEISGMSWAEYRRRHKASGPVHAQR